MRPPAIAHSVDRRTFLKASVSAAGALLVTIPLPPRSLSAATRAAEASTWCVYLTLHPDNTAELMSPVMEMGQFMRTTGPMILADEMDLDWSLLTITWDEPVLMRKNGKGELDSRYGQVSAGGSQSVRNNWDYMRQAGATVRRMLVEEAAARWRMSPDSLIAQDSFVIDPAGDRRISYGELAAKAARRRVRPEQIKLKQRSEYRIMGKDAVSADIRDIVMGRPLFGIDEEYPNALQAVIERAPALHADIASYNREAVLAMPGVRHVIEMPRKIEDHWPGGDAQVLAAGIAVVADSLWAAMQGRKALQARWKNGTSDDSAQQIQEFRRLVAGDGVANKLIDRGDVDAAFATADLVLDQTYEKPLFAHACMEPFNCIADIRSDSATVITGHQVPHWVAREVENITGIDGLKVTVVSKRMGGGFGRRGDLDYVREAVTLSYRIKQPVKVTWTREDDIQRDFFDAAAVMRVRAALKNKRIVGWQHRQAQTRGRPEASEYFPANVVSNYRVEQFASTSNIPCGPWRAPTILQWAFATESMLDELAHAAGEDPLAFRLQWLQPYREYPIENWAAKTIHSGRMAACYEAAARLADWGRPRPKGTGLGIAGQFTFGSYAACVLEVSVSEDNELKLLHAWGAIDCGFAINPNHIRSQMEGGFVDGLNAALFNDARVSEGRVVNDNFGSLRWIRLREAPLSIEVAIIDSGYGPTGVGEPPLPPAGAALANAIFAACGKRVRRMPIADSFRI
ncbi:xanthine dehydrogenase family protein molybdopterin-binding subunit [Steroidobacter sp. S1-65]|uniref:Xanthine dehydrogenase family protein molybdopterin-binding subunit n=1 Tax=Steroidobacter gossypii TaxID=2805490 RepID=A0ABS1X3S7_9GAMM|nr:molybdopterin cofactor-binding domain-containing protein [Steroidobacter gossypii]MBM0107881.1 xanthine dehydrogenase family protein molybdopterin-binding subunit [Steroidobacter gossypii]